MDSAPEDCTDDSGVTTDRNGERTYLSIQSLRHNMEVIDNCRTSLTLFAGGMTGVLGCTGLQGAAAFLLTYAFISAGLILKMRLDVPGHTNMALPQFAFGEMGKYGLSFILFWTLTYALVYIY